MGIQVTTLNPVAGVTSSRPRVSVVVTEPIASVNAALLAAAASSSVAGATVTAVVPVSRLSYILMASSAQLDTTGRFQFIPDQVFVADVVAKGVSKTPRETFAAQDYSTITYDKALADAVTFVDSVVRTLVFIRSFASAVEVTDRPAITFARPAADEFSTPDQASLLTIKSSADFVGAVDQAVTSFAKALSSIFATSDRLTSSVSKSTSSEVLILDASRFTLARPAASAFTLTDSQTVGSQKGSFDTVSATDSDTLDIGKVNKDTFSFQELLAQQVTKYAADQASTTDQATRSTDKVLADAFSFAHFVNRSIGRVISDGVAMNDTADTVDGLAMQASKGVSNVVFATDSDAFAFSAAKTETATIVSVGSLRSQGYCDPTYFAEDYVGDSRTFT